MVWAIWVTGLPGSGKTTIVNELKKKLELEGVRAIVVGIDEVRKIYNLEDYSPKGRETAYSKLVEIGVEQVKSGKNVIFDATANKRAFREAARRRIRNFAEIYVKCPLKICMEREFSRDEERAYLIYKQRKYVPGMQVPYEEPLNPEVIVESDKIIAGQAADLIIERLKSLLQ